MHIVVSIARCFSLPRSVPSNYVLFNHPPTTTAMSQKPHSTESIASTAIALVWTFTSLAIVVVGLRIYTRTRLINGLGLEDLAISASVVRTHMPPKHLPLRMVVQIMTLGIGLSRYSQ